MTSVSSLQDFASVVRLRAEQRPDDRAFTYLENGKDETASMTYRELDEQARRLAALLQARDLVGQRAILLFPPGLDFSLAFIACLYAGVVAVPAYPPEPHRLAHTLRRLQNIIKDARSSVVLTSSMIFAFAQNIIQETKNEELGALTWLTADEAEVMDPNTWQDPGLSGESLAFLQYTSGSTSEPKGVMIQHRHLLANVRMSKEAIGFDGFNDVCVSWLPLYHDMGLIGMMLNPLYNGSHAVLMPPYAFLKKPLCWLEALSHYRGTITAAPNFAYDLAVRKITPSQRDALELSSINSMVNGAEPVRHDTLERFIRYFEPVGLRRRALQPCYGMAETVLFVTGAPPERRPCYHSIDKEQLERHRIVAARPDEDDALTLVSSGRIWGDERLIIVHPDTRKRLHDNEVGEIWIAGSHIAAGYWGRPEQTEETFHARTADTDEGPFLRTGDLGFMLDGQLYVTGRRKDLLIIRGRNIYPQDVERTMDDVRKLHPEIRPGCAAVVAIEVNDEEQLVAFQEVDLSRSDRFDPQQTLASLRSAIVQTHEVQPHAIVLLERGTLPKTSSGKVMRHACKRAFLDDFSEKHNLKILGRTLDDVEAAEEQLPTAPIVEPEARADSAARADQLIDWLREYAPERINSRLIDERRCIPPHVVLDFGNHGLLGMQVPAHYGGAALTTMDALRVTQQLAAIDQTLALFVTLHNALGIRPVLRSAKATLRDEIMPSLAQGRALISFALAEPNAGSNLQALRSEASPIDVGRWQLHGEKCWIGSGAWASHVNVFVKHAIDDAQAQGLSGFVLGPHTPGWRPGPETLSMGMRGLAQNSAQLDGVEVTQAQLLGRLGEGLSVVQDALSSARLAISSVALGVMKRCVQLMTRFASRRLISTGWLLDNSLTLHTMHEIIQETTALETLIQQLAAHFDDGSPVPLHVVAACKTMGAEFAWRASDCLVQLLGGRGYTESNIAPQILRDTRALRLLAGPTETLRAHCGAALLEEADTPDTLLAFLKNDLSSPGTAQKLGEVVGAVQEQTKKSRKSRSGGAPEQHRLNDALGELYGYGLLVAGLDGQLQGSRDPMLRGALDTLHQRFTQRAEDISSGGAWSAKLPTARNMAAVVQAYTVAIGDMDPGLIGEDRNFAPLLAIEQSVTVTAPTPTPASARPRATKKVEPQAKPKAKPKVPLQEDGFSALKNWMIGWIAMEMGLDKRILAKKVGFSGSSRTPFSELGIDSVTAIQFVGALEEKLNRPIPTSALWDHDNVDDLTRHLLNLTKKDA